VGKSGQHAGLGTKRIATEKRLQSRRNALKLKVAPLFDLNLAAIGKGKAEFFAGEKEKPYIIADSEIVAFESELGVVRGEK